MTNRGLTCSQDFDYSVSLSGAHSDCVVRVILICNCYTVDVFI